jgi:putative hydrolase
MQMEPVEALERIAEVLQRVRNSLPKAQAFRRAADTIRDIPIDELRTLADTGKLTNLPGIGKSTAKAIEEALRGETPSYLADLKAADEPPTEHAAKMRAALRGDLHLHSDWSDGGHTIEAMARHAAELGHDYLALTDHSPQLKIAHGLTPERLRDQLDVVARLNDELAPFRILTGIEVDILDDGSLDQEPELLEELDVVVASVHSKLRMDRQPMTDRMVAALASPHVDILGHCTGRLIGKRPESTFDADYVFAACARFGTAVEINSRPERMDPPQELLALALSYGCFVSIDSDAHATGQLEWQPHGCEKAAAAEVPIERIVNTWAMDDLLAWTTAA